MPTVFRVTSASTADTLHLEAVAPSTPYEHTYFYPTGPISDALQLELDLSPLQEGEDIVWSQGSSIRIVNTATPQLIVDTTVPRDTPSVTPQDTTKKGVKL